MAQVVWCQEMAVLDVNQEVTVRVSQEFGAMVRFRMERHSVKNGFSVRKPAWAVARVYWNEAAKIKNKHVRASIAVCKSKWTTARIPDIADSPRCVCAPPAEPGASGRALNPLGSVLWRIVVSAARLAHIQRVSGIYTDPK